MVAKTAQNGRVTHPVMPIVSRETLELCDWLIDGITLSAQAPDFIEQATRIAAARDEIARALRDVGGTPLIDQRTAGDTKS